MNIIHQARLGTSFLEEYTITKYPVHRVITQQHSIITMASNIDSKPAKGYVFHLKEYESVNSDQFKLSGLEPGAMAHPALILESNAHKGVAVIFIVSLTYY